MADDAETTYVVTRHAPPKGDVRVLSVAIAHWVQAGGSKQWCLEYWEDRGEADHDLDVEAEAAEMQRAREEFGVEESDWRSGPKPWDTPE
jgi:hypothetical protein